MQKIQFKININAPGEKVWKVLWDEQTYNDWTSVFSEGSKAVTDWSEGSKVLFLNADNDGMYGVIEKNIENEFMSIKHMGNIKKGVEGPENEWSGSLENYTLKEADGKTELTIDLDSTDDFKDFFEKTFPKALGKVKELSEK